MPDRPQCKGPGPCVYPLKLLELSSGIITNIETTQYMYNHIIKQFMNVTEISAALHLPEKNSVRLDYSNIPLFPT